MNVLMIFPYASSLYSKSTDAIRIQRELYVKWITAVSNAGCKITRILEDELAGLLLNECGVSNVETLALSCRSDIKFLTAHPECNKYADEVLDKYTTTKVYESKIERKYAAPIMSSGNKTEWLQKRTECITKRLKGAANILMSKSECILYFKSRNANYVPSRLSSIRHGDGLLYIEVDLDDSMVTCYYGGMWISEEDAIKILFIGG